MFGRVEEGNEAISGTLEEEWCRRIRAERLSDAMLETVRACLGIIAEQKTELRSTERRVVTNSDNDDDDWDEIDSQ